jgi:hypothetical protein
MLDQIIFNSKMNDYLDYQMGQSLRLQLFHSLRKSSREADRRGWRQALGAVNGLAYSAMRWACWQGASWLKSSYFNSLLLRSRSAFLNSLTPCGASLGSFLLLAEMQLRWGSIFLSLMKKCFFRTASFNF